MLPVRICSGGVGTTGVPTATGQHRDDEVTRTEPVGWTRTRTREFAVEGNAHAVLIGLKRTQVEGSWNPENRERRVDSMRKWRTSGE
jgi:hypothetical protein